MKYKDFGETVAVKIERGEEVLESLQKVCEELNIKSGLIFGIGALSEATIIDGSTTEYLAPNPKEFKEPMEIASAMGNITEKDGKPFIHLHGSIGLQNHTSTAGHIKRGIVYLVGEFFIIRQNWKIKRVYDEKIKMWVFDL